MGERWQGPWRPPLRGFRAASHASGVHKRDSYGLSMRWDFNHERWLSIQDRLVMTRGGSEGGPHEGSGEPHGGSGEPHELLGIVFRVKINIKHDFLTIATKYCPFGGC